jgi:hypothetical protein
MVRSSSVVSASYPLAQKQERRVMRLKGYGNAIVPPQAAQFIIASMEIINAVHGRGTEASEAA